MRMWIIQGREYCRGTKKSVDETRYGKRTFLIRYLVDPCLTQSAHNERNISDSQRVRRIIGLPHMGIASRYGGEAIPSM